MRAAIYARYSTENQSDASIEDQLEVCRRYIRQLGWQMADVYADRAISGANDHRPDYRRMLRAAESRDFDVVVCEALDRLSRRLAEIARLHDQLDFKGIRIHAVNLGLVTPMHVGLLGTMSQLYLSDLKQKTRRGQLGRALAGKIPGGKAFGYRVVTGHPGEREIFEPEAKIVRRIFRDFARGHSPRAIARALNREAVPGPDDRAWRDTTIRGQADRGTGILNNAIYVGRLEWNKCSYVKDPASGKRLARPNPHSAWEIVEVPALRIVPDTLWTAAKDRQSRITSEIEQAGSSGIRAARRRKFLLSGLLTCASCRGGFTIIGPDRYGCATRRAKGTCSNKATIGRLEIERRALNALKGPLTQPEFLAEFVNAFNDEMKAHSEESERNLRATCRELNSVEQKIRAVISAIEAGAFSESLRDRLGELEARKVALLNETSVPPLREARWHPRIGEVYADKIRNLETALNDDAVRDEAGEILRTLIAQIEIGLRTERGDLEAVLEGDLAAILALGGENPESKRPGTEMPGRLLTVVAGTGFEPVTFRL